MGFYGKVVSSVHRYFNLVSLSWSAIHLLSIVAFVKLNVNCLTEVFVTWLLCILYLLLLNILKIDCETCTRPVCKKKIGRRDYKEAFEIRGR